MRTARELSHFVSITLNLDCTKEVFFTHQMTWITLQVKTELRELSPEELSSFIEEFNRGIFDMVSSNDVNEKKGGILAISESSIPKSPRHI